MKLKESSTNNLESPFELKIYNYWLFVAAVIITIFFLETLYKIIFGSKSTNAILILGSIFLLSLSIYTFLLFLRPKPVLKIGKQGIWTKDKDWVRWENIESFYINKTYFRGNIFLRLFLTSNSPKDEFSVVISNDRIIRKYIELYKGGYKIIDIGNNEEVISMDKKNSTT